MLHFAASAYVGESVANPAKYYENNITSTLNLLQAMLEGNCKNIIFSSTCATYGNPLSLPINELHPQNPINPYGYTKLVIEQMLKDFAHAYGLRFCALRYFNAAGASNLFNLGESHHPETHLIPIIIQSALKQREGFEVYGGNLDTKDGSCVRDYIHIDDLGAAHILALSYCLNGGANQAFNLSNNQGYSVFEVIKAIEKYAHTKLNYSIKPKREGDPAVLIGSSERAREILGWRAHFNLENIIQTALRWHTNPRY